MIDYQLHKMCLKSPGTPLKASSAHICPRIFETHFTTPPQFGFLSMLFSSRRKTRSGHFSGIVGRPIVLGTRVKFRLKVLMRRLNELLMGIYGKDGNTPCLFVRGRGRTRTWTGSGARAPSRTNEGCRMFVSFYFRRHFVVGRCEMM